MNENATTVSVDDHDVDGVLDAAELDLGGGFDGDDPLDSLTFPGDSDAVERLINEEGGSVIPPIHRAGLQSNLIDLAVAISDEDLESMTETQCEILFDWMDKRGELSHKVQSEDSSDTGVVIDDGAWVASLPDFMVLGEPNGEVRTIRLVTVEATTAEDVDPVEILAQPAAEVEKPATDHMSLINEQNDLAKGYRKILEDAQSEVRAAKGREKEARENLDNAEKELSRIIDDAKAGQGRLDFEGSRSSPFPDSPLADVVSVKKASEGKPVATKTPISDLGAKKLKKLIGAEEFDAWKDREDPVGLSDSQIDKLVDAEIETVESFEKHIRENPNWHRDIKGFGEKAIQRIVSTLVAYHKVNPVVEC